LNLSTPELHSHNQSQHSSTGLTRRRFLGIAIPTVAALAGVVSAEGLREASQISLKKIMLPVRQLPLEFDGFTIAQLSDFHYHPLFTAKVISDAVHLVNRFCPDIVVLTGDFVTISLFGSGRRKKSVIEAQAEPCADLLSQLRPKQGIFAVLGNHDQGSQPAVVTESLRSRGIRVLRNEAVALELSGSRVWLAGVDDVLEGAADLPRALHDIRRNETTILLAHEPDFADYAAAHPVSVQLSGHSHGGQIRLPFVGPPCLPELARKYPWGLHQVGGLKLYTNCGLGTIELPIRWNCPPEVTLVCLVNGSAHQPA
jgi:predicted MPP superfamily phosphohydrolase